MQSVNNNSFLQSLEWADFQKNLGRTTFYIKSLDAHGVEVDLPFSLKYAYLPHINFMKSDFVSFVKSVSGLVEKVKGQGYVFLRIEPLIEKNEEHEKALQSLGFKKSERFVQPKRTIIISLGKSKEDLWDDLRSNTRYSIRQANKLDVRFQALGPKEELSVFLSILKDTAVRGGFRLHPLTYYKRLYELFGNKFENSSRTIKIDVFLAKYHDVFIAGNLILYHKNKAYYLAAGSKNEFKNLNASAFLLWQAILEAKKLGCKSFDLWGLLDEEKYKGLNYFKRGFGGREVEYLGAFEYALRPALYFLYKISRKLLLR